MNHVVLVGRLTKDPEVRQTQSTNIARFSLAVDRVPKQGEEKSSDFITCVAFGKTADFIGNYFHQGSKMILSGRIQTGSYTNKDNQKVYTTDVVAENVEFGDSKNNSSGNNGQQYQQYSQNQRQTAYNQTQNQQFSNQGMNYKGQAQNAGFAPNNAYNNGYQRQPGFMSIPDNVNDENMPFN